MAARSSAIHDASPNAHLRDFLLRFFSEGPHLSALRYRICSKAIKLPLQAVVRGGPLQLPPSLPKEDDLQVIVRAQINDHAFVQTLVAQSAWDDSKMAAEFVTLLLADLADLDARVCAAAFNSRKLGGMPSMAQVRLEPSGDLPAALAKAVAVLRAGDAGRAAMGGVTVPSSCTALAVALADCTALRAEEQKRNASVSVARSVSYAHRFVLLVDGTGVGLYQAWGSGGGRGSTSGGGGGSTSGNGAGGAGNTSRPGSSGGGAAGEGGGTAGGCSAAGFSLQDWLQRSTTVMSHEQATEFARTFQEFCARIHWDDAANGLYLQLFGVDLRAVAAARGLPLPGRIRSWVRILEVPYVTAARIQANARLFM